jgi:hypothetical protein
MVAPGSIGFGAAIAHQAEWEKTATQTGFRRPRRIGSKVGRALRLLALDLRSELSSAQRVQSKGASMWPFRAMT